MSVNALSSHLFNRCATPPTAPAAAASGAAAPAPTDRLEHDEPRSGGGAQRLVQAIMTALRELGIGVPAPAPAPAPAAASTAASTPAPASAPAPAASDTTTAAQVPPTTTTATAPAGTPAPAQPADAAPAASTPASLADLVDAFAHALFQALRHGPDASTEKSRRNDAEHGDRHDHGEAHGHHHNAHRSYGDIAQRLQALALSLGHSAPAAAAAAPAPAATPSTQATPPVEAPVVPAPAASSAAAVGATPSNSLLNAFTDLFNVLKPAGSTSAAAETDMAANLRLFLQTLAQALRHDAGHGAQVPQVGGLVDTSA